MFRIYLFIILIFNIGFSGTRPLKAISIIPNKKLRECNLNDTIISNRFTTPSKGYQSRNFIEKLKQGQKITIATMGTSLTIGARPGDSGWAIVMMNDWLNKDFPGQVKLFNEAVSGSASGKGPQNNFAFSGLNKLPTVINHKPDVVFIEFGTNDAYLPYKISLSESRKNLNYIISSIRKANPETEIILQTMNPVIGEPAKARPEILKYFQLYYEIAKKWKLVLIDNYSHWIYLLKNNLNTFKKLVPDDIHPLPNGYRQILLPEIKKKLM